MKSFKWGAIILFLFMCMFLAACSTKTDTEDVPSDNTTDDAEKPPEPITLKFLHAHGIDDEGFREQYKEPIEEKFPYITIERIDSDNLDDLIASGEIPDIYFVENPIQIKKYVESELAMDLSDLIEKHQFDLNRIQPTLLTEHRNFSDGNLYTIPLSLGLTALHYNKDIFDLFGEEYPTPGMTWAEALEKGRRMTGERNGIYYRGIDLANPYVPLMQLAVNLTDPETGEVQFDQPEVAMYFDLLDEIINIQGTNDGDHFDGGRFVSQQTTAMTVEFVQALNWWQNEESLNEAVAPLPVWDDRPPVSHRPDGGIIHLSINPHSPHKEVAFRILTYFTEYEYQLFASRQGIGPSTVNEEVLSEFFQDYDFADETNVASMFEFPPANPPMPISPWDKYVDLNPRRYATSGMDRNEYLRVIAEETAAKIEEAKVTEAES